ncbi:MAG TPA: ABC transporter substrate binding protein [Acidimicrobiales bacterium]|nr:ABC transporter substrate binding protein [Acidimicrobiales bacterium]
MRRAVIGIVLVVIASLVACGDDGEPERTIALLRTSPVAEENQEAFLAELEGGGWRVGENLVVLAPDPGEVYEDAETGRAAVEQWLEEGVDLIYALSTTSGLTAKEAAPDVPVLVLANDPVASGIIADPRSPEANVTGVAFRVPPDRTLDVARQMGRDITTIGFLWPGDDVAAEPVRDGLVDAADALGVELVDESFVGADEVAGAIDAMVERGVQVVVLANASATVRAFDAIEAATTRARLPVLGNIESNPFATVILAPDLEAAYRQIGRQAVRLLGGTDVADVPLEEPGVFRLTVRPSNAARVGVELPEELLAQADEVSG